MTFQVLLGHDAAVECVQKECLRSVLLMPHRLEAEKARASVQAQADAKRHVQDEVSRILSAERAVAQESLQQAVIRERIATEDERLRAQLFVSPRRQHSLLTLFSRRVTQK